MSWDEAAEKLLPKINWPAAVVVVAALVFYALVLAPDYITSEDLRAQTKEIKKAIQDQSVTDAVHDVSIESLNTANKRQDDDIREMRDR